MIVFIHLSTVAGIAFLLMGSDCRANGIIAITSLFKEIAELASSRDFQMKGQYYLPEVPIDVSRGRWTDATDATPETKNHI